MIGTCRSCGTGVQWIECPTGGWWAHLVHPPDDHDADLPHPEEIAATVRFMTSEPDSLLEKINHHLNFDSHAEGGTVQDQALWLYWNGVPFVVRAEQVDWHPSQG